MHVIPAHCFALIICFCWESAFRGACTILVGAQIDRIRAAVCAAEGRRKAAQAAERPELSERASI